MRLGRRSKALAAALAVAIGSAAGCAPPAPRPPVAVAPPPPPAPAAKHLEFEATAYSIEGTTASGKKAREGIVAADPRHLPIGTRIRVHDAGPYSGEYLVADTGRAIKGREIDIYIARDGEAKKFGRKKVKVEVLGSDT